VQRASPVAPRIYPWSKISLHPSTAAQHRRYHGYVHCASRGWEGGKMEKLMVLGGIWWMCAFCALLFVRGASAQTALRRVPVVSRHMREAALRQDLSRDY
jgi:hypothetical protein